MSFFSHFTEWLVPLRDAESALFYPSEKRELGLADVNIEM